MSPSKIAVRRPLLLLALLAVPGLTLAQYAPYAPPPGGPPPAAPPPAAYPPPPPGYPPGYAPPPAYAQPQQVQAQSGGKLQLSAVAGWVTSSNVYMGAGHLRIDPTNSWGAEIAFAGAPGSKIALKWVYYKPDVQFVSQSYAYSSSSTFSVDTNYFLIQGEKGFRQGKVEPFFGGSIGAVVYAPDSFKMGGLNYSPGDTWYFAFGLAAGAKIFVSQKVALRLGIEMLAPVYFSGGSYYVGTGGSGMAVSGGIPTISGNFTAGLTFAP
jgi:opacity protein-like surface antigen